MTSDMPDARGRIVYLPHGGGPMPLLGDPAHQGLVTFLADLARTLPRPEAIVLISAHWEASRATITGGARPPLIYDYYGFPPESYRIEYSAPGDPALAERVQRLLEAGGIEAHVDGERGFDHGMFVPLKIMYPQADIACVQLSMVSGLDPQVHLDLGRALSELHDSDVLVVGSGLSFHNLRAFFGSAADSHAKSAAFDDWLTETCAGSGLSAAEREHRLLHWHEAPHARFCHPREEHLIPLHVCFGMAASRTPAAQVVYNDDLMGQRVCGLLW